MSSTYTQMGRKDPFIRGPGPVVQVFWNKLIQRIKAQFGGKCQDVKKKFLTVTYFTKVYPQNVLKLEKK